MSGKDTGSPAGGRTLPAGFRRHGQEQRRGELSAVFGLEEAELSAILASPSNRELADVMVEAAVGCLPVPLGVADGFLIDGREVSVPMAVEEPSVIAAASYAARLVRRGGGFATWSSEPLMSAQVYIEDAATDAVAKVAEREADVRDALSGTLASMTRRGGGFRGLRSSRLPGSGVLRVDLIIDVRDSMGANLLNTAAELARPLLEEASGGRALMAILTNEAAERITGARFRLHADGVSARLPAGMSAREALKRVVSASSVAQEDRTRAVTHNKGIMNGISSLALATMNDTRAVEAAAHAWAAREGRYRGLSRYRMEGDALVGEIELPLALATTGGAVSFHPAARACLRVLGNPDSPGLCRIAASVGLAQNFAALLALVTTGIQQGHMKLHAARLAYEAGARGPGIRRIAEELSRSGTISLSAARELVERTGETPG